MYLLYYKMKAILPKREIRVLTSKQEASRRLNRKNKSSEDEQQYKLIDKEAIIKDIIKDQFPTFNRTKDTLDAILEYPIEITEFFGKSMTIFDFDSLPDWYSIPVIEKVHTNFSKYIKYVQEVISSNYIVTQNRNDFVSIGDFTQLLLTLLKAKEDIMINRLAEIVDMIIAKLNNYSTPGYAKYKSIIRVMNREFYNIAFLKIKPEIITSFESKIDYKHAVANYKRDYNITHLCYGGADESNVFDWVRVKAVIEYLTSNPIFVRIDKEEFSRSSGGFKHMIENKVKNGYCSSDDTIMACYLLGCKIYFGNCIGICLDPARDKKYRTKQKGIVYEEIFGRKIDIYPDSEE